MSVVNSETGNARTALSLSRAGLYIFPCKPDKKPLVKWSEVSTNSSEQVRDWWQLWPDALVGINCGRSGITVLDGDRHGDGPDGVSALQALCGGDFARLACPMSLTPNNGVHLYFRARDAEPPSNSRGGLPDGIDVRGNGGYVIAPGSVLPDGRSWQHQDGAPTLIECLRAACLPMVPDNIMELVAARRSARTSPALKHGTEGAAESASRELQEAVEELSAALKGNRNDTLNAKALRMGRFVAHGHLHEETVCEAFMQACQRNGLIQDDGVAAFNATFDSGMRAGVHKAGFDARVASEIETGIPPEEGPQPLVRPTGRSAAFPLDALGDVLGPAAGAIIDIVQCPPALAAQSVLAAASFTVQAHADVAFPATQQVKPCSLFLITVGESGERKSAVDYYALRAIREREKELLDDYADLLKEYSKSKNVWEIQRKRLMMAKSDQEKLSQKLDQLGEEPERPLSPMLTCGEPTFEGLSKLLAEGQPSMGLFSDEGGAFIGGHSMSAENRLRTAAGLSNVWDGAPLKRVRVLDGSSTVPGKRVSLHLLAQPEAANILLGDPVLRDQGFLSRLLVSAPTSTAGTRLQKDPSPDSFKVLEIFDGRLFRILRQPFPLALKTRNVLQPRVIQLDEDAQAAWKQYADSVELRLGEGKPFEAIKGFGSKLSEHALRVSGVLTLIENIHAEKISLHNFERATRLADYYATEALRLLGVGQVDPALQGAERLRKWLMSHACEHVSVRMLIQRGPNSLRDSKNMSAAIDILVKHGWLRPVSGKVEIDGKMTSRAWTVIREAER